MSTAHPGDVIAAGVGSGIARGSTGIPEKNATKTGETPRQGDVFPAPDGVETVAQAVEKAGARAGEGELEAVEREVKFVNQPARGSGSQTRREVVIVVQRGNSADAWKKVFVLIVGIRILVKRVAEREDGLLGEVMVDAPGYVIGIREGTAGEMKEAASAVENRSVGIGVNG